MEAVGRSKYIGIAGNQHPGGSSTSELLGDPHQDRDREGGGFSETARKLGVAIRLDNWERRPLQTRELHGVTGGHLGKNSFDITGKADTVGETSVCFFWCKENNKMRPGGLIDCRWRTSG